MKDKVFENKAKVGDFEFDKEVANVFDDMVDRSVPFYKESQKMIVDLSNYFSRKGSNIYDFGSSTGTTLLNLSQNLEEKEIKLIGVDNSGDMIKKAVKKFNELGIVDGFEFINDDLVNVEVDNASVVIMAHTLQFVRPLYRDILVRNIYNGLNNRGVLIVFEKVLSDNSMLNRAFIDFYYDYKREKKYSEIEIVKKREALENVLIPYRVSENIELFKRNGFQIVDEVFRWYNWAGFVAIKNEVEK